MRILRTLAIVCLVVNAGCPAPTPPPPLPGLVNAPDIAADTLAGPQAICAGDACPGDSVLYDVTWNDAGKEERYAVILGDNAGATVEPDGNVQLNDGFAFLVGHWPRIRTTRVSAGAEGSSLIVQVVKTDAGVLDRVFFVDGDRAFFTTLDGQEVSWTDPDIFCEVNAAGVVTELRLSADDEARGFVDLLRAAAKALGLLL